MTFFFTEDEAKESLEIRRRPEPTESEITLALQALSKETGVEVIELRVTLNLIKNQLHFGTRGAIVQLKVDLTGKGFLKRYGRRHHD